jgi:uncharacterized YkwD family protein
MKKQILTLTLCLFTSLAVGTPVAAANVNTCKNPTRVIVSGNIGNIQNISSLINKSLANASNAAKLKSCKKVKKAVKSNKTTKKTVTQNNSTKPSTSTATNPSTTTKPATTVSNGSYTQFQNEVIRLVNQERAAAGLKALSANTQLNKIATLKSEDMVKNNYFSHQSPTYGSPFDMLKQFGVSYSAAGENIAYGQTTPAEVMNGWMNSPGHRANILNSNFTQIGVGIAKKANGQLVWTQTFTRP